jgi:tyrosine-protein phosphatase YwqE
MIIDFHAHVLPGADHGSVDAEEAKKQLELAYYSGLDLIVAHLFLPDKDY